MRAAVVSATVAALALLGGAAAADPRYDRASWIDADHDGCNTREEMLAAPGPCPPRVGDLTITDPYTALPVHGRGHIQVDHIVPQHWWYDHVAKYWTKGQFRDWANDDTNLILTSDVENERKGERGPSTWLPPLPSAKCWYLMRWQIVLTKYNVVLPDSDPDKRAIDEGIRNCIGT